MESEGKARGEGGCVGGMERGRRRGEVDRKEVT